MTPLPKKWWINSQQLEHYISLQSVLCALSNTDFSVNMSFVTSLKWILRNWISCFAKQLPLAAMWRGIMWRWLMQPQWILTVVWNCFGRKYPVIAESFFPLSRHIWYLNTCNHIVLLMLLMSTTSNEVLQASSGWEYPHSWHVGHPEHRTAITAAQHCTQHSAQTDSQDNTVPSFTLYVISHLHLWLILLFRDLNGCWLLGEPVDTTD